MVGIYFFFKMVWAVLIIGAVLLLAVIAITAVAAGAAIFLILMGLVVLEWVLAKCGLWDRLGWRPDLFERLDRMAARFG